MTLMALQNPYPTSESTSESDTEGIDGDIDTEWAINFQNEGIANDGYENAEEDQRI